MPSCCGSIPGVNITQVSARDINITSRAATGTLATGQLAMLDGRSLYQDFFGFVMWDFLPVNFNEVKQVEVIRGPASAVWGANALYGVVNVISKTPREIEGREWHVRVRRFRSARCRTRDRCGRVSATWADAPNDRWSYKLSGGGYSQDAFARPTGRIPCDNPEVCLVPTTNYPRFANEGTTQPKFDARVDYDYEDGRRLSFSGGFAGTDGIMHSGIGPVRHQQRLGDGLRARRTSRKGGLRAGFFTNILNGDADQLLTVRPERRADHLRLRHEDLRLRPVERAGARHAPRAQLRRQPALQQLRRCRLRPTPTIAPSSASTSRTRSSSRTCSDGSSAAALDRFDYIDDVVFSPRTTFMIKPSANQTFRVSYNRAYRSPSVINNHIDLIISRADRPPADQSGARRFPYLLPVSIVGNPDLREQSLDAFEVGYSGVVVRRASDRLGGLST